MSNYLAGMIARSEHTHMNQSSQPVLDFDRRGYVNKPGWVAHSVGTLFQSLSRISTPLRMRLNLRPEQKQTITHDIPLSDRG